MEIGFIFRIGLLFFLLILSGFFSGSETALFSLSHVQKKRIGTGGSTVDRSLRWLLGQPRRLIVTLLVGNEIVNISLSAVIAALIHDVRPDLTGLKQVFVSVLVAIPLLLVIGEVTPKALAIRIPEGWSRGVARPLRAFSLIIAPLRLSVRAIADGIINVLGGKPPQRERSLGEEEFIALVEMGSKGGQLEQDEKDIICNVFEFGDMSVSEVMTEAKDVFAVSFRMPLQEIVRDVVEKEYSRVPVYKGKRSHIVGVLYSKDLVGFGQVLELSGKTLKELVRQPFFVPKTTKLSRLFREFQERRIHIAIVVDEYGHMAGVVTMEDLLDELFGELVESDNKNEMLETHDTDSGSGEESRRRESSKADKKEGREPTKADKKERREPSKADKKERREPTKADKKERREPTKADKKERREPTKADRKEGREPSKTDKIEGGVLDSRRSAGGDHGDGDGVQGGGS